MLSLVVQLLLQPRDLSRRRLLEFGDAGLQPLHVLHQLRDLFFLRGKFDFKPGAGDDVHRVLVHITPASPGGLIAATAFAFN